MNDTRIALKKILTELLSEEYPDISSVQVTDDEWDDNHKYKVFLGVKYGDLNKLDTDDVRDYVKRISKYVLGSNESIYQILFYNTDTP